MNGLMPFRAGVAGFCFSFKLSARAILKDPFFFNSVAATPIKASIAPLTTFAFRPVVSATALYAAVAVIPVAAPFIAFIAFIGAMAAKVQRRR